MDINGVEFYEDTAEPKSPTTSFATQNSRTIRSLQLRLDGLADEETKWEGAQALLGYNVMENDAVGGGRRWISRVLPHAFPTPATAVNIGPESIHWASSIPSVVPVAGSRGVDPEDRARYDAWRYNVMYERKLYNLWEDDDTDLLAQAGPLAVAPARPDEGDALRRGWAKTRFIIKTIRDASTTVSVPGGLFKYVDAVADNRKALHAAFPYQLHRSIVEYRHISLPLDAVPFAALTACANGVNDVTFDGFAVDTLRFDTWSMEIETGPLGDWLVNLNLRFMYVPNIDPVSGTAIGHVGAPRVVGGVFKIVKVSVSGDPATADNAGQRPFKRVDLSSLFRPT